MKFTKDHGLTLTKDLDRLVRLEGKPEKETFWASFLDDLADKFKELKESPGTANRLGSFLLECARPPQTYDDGFEALAERLHHEFSLSRRNAALVASDLWDRAQLPD